MSAFLKKNWFNAPKDNDNKDDNDAGSWEKAQRDDGYRSPSAEDSDDEGPSPADEYSNARGAHKEPPRAPQAPEAKPLLQ